MHGFAGFTPVSGVPGDEGSVVVIHARFGKDVLDSEITTTKRIELERLEQTQRIDRTTVFSVTEFEADGFDRTVIHQSLTVEFEGVPFWQRALAKFTTRISMFSATQDYVHYVEKQAVLELSGALEEETPDS